MNGNVVVVVEVVVDGNTIRFFSGGIGGSIDKNDIAT